MTTTDIATRPTSDEFPALAVKPLNQTQVRNLQKIVTGDFDELEQQLSERITQQHARRVKEVNEAYGDEAALNAAKEEAQRLQERMQAEARAFEDSLADRGLKMKDGQRAFTVGGNFWQLGYTGNEAALRRLNEAKGTLLRQMSVYINTLRRSAERTILMASLTGSAATDMLGGIPSAEDALSTVLDKLGENAADSIAELLGDEPIQ